MRRRRGKRKAPSPGMTAMGDIAFLLITFFVLVSKMATEDQIHLVLPKSPDVHQVEAQAKAKIAVDNEANIYFDGNRISKERLRENLVRVLGDPNLEPAEGAPGQPGQPGTAPAAPPRPAEEEGEGPAKSRYDRLVLLKCDEKCPHNVYFPILETLAELNAQVAISADNEGAAPPPTKGAQNDG